MSEPSLPELEGEVPVDQDRMGQAAGYEIERELAVSGASMVAARTRLGAERGPGRLLCARPLLELDSRNRRKD